jgi:N-methylhydantoinase A/oxoprolinase/acetone carboxylase beta subunit
VELVNVKVEVIGQAKIESLETINQTSPAKQAKPINNRLRRSGNEQIAVYNRDELAVNQCIRGPAIITETASTTWLKSGWRLQMDALGNLLLKKS